MAQTLVAKSQPSVPYEAYLLFIIFVDVFIIIINNEQVIMLLSKYVVPSYCLAEMYTGHVACCPLVSHVEYFDGTDRQT